MEPGRRGARRRRGTAAGTPVRTTERRRPSRARRRETGAARSGKIKTDPKRHDWKMFFSAETRAPALVPAQTRAQRAAATPVLTPAAVGAAGERREEGRSPGRRRGRTARRGMLQEIRRR